jgi:transglutaminase-like putative cysteine protease
MDVELAIQPTTRRLSIRHATEYLYDQPVSRSLHYVHHCPRSTPIQSLRSHSLTTQPAAMWNQYDDIFGNPTARFEVAGPFVSLSIIAEFTVDLAHVDPFDFKTPTRPQFPLAWTPADYAKLAPYLAESEFDPGGTDDIRVYAQSFATRNRQDVLETVFDINLTLFREFDYRPGSTVVTTPASEILRTKQGVCQDFANLFICMARHLQIPARYVCGYLLNQAAVGSQASHAWVQLYLPGIGWKDFDPTNGILPTGGHIVLAWGPSYRDVAPIWGTLYSRAKETMSVDVSVTEIGDFA